MLTRVQPRLYLDIEWADLASVFAPLRMSREALARAAAEPWGANAVAALSVRTAFDAALSVLKQPPGASVAMSGVTIQNMADVAAAHGLTIAPVDLDLAALTLSAQALDRALAASGARVYVHAHLYGARNDLASLYEVCRTRGVFMIEDCAQAFAGAPSAEMGTADLSLYSFGPIKARTCLGGAIAVCGDAAFAGKLSAALAAHEPMPEGWMRTRACKYALLKALSSPRPYALTLAGLRTSGRDPEAVIGGAARGFRGVDLMAALRRAPPAALLRLMARRFVAAPDAAWRTHAQAVLDRAFAGKLERPGAAAGANAAWLYPVLVDDPACAAADMRQLGFDATSGTTSLRAITGSAHGAGPQAKYLIDHVLYLPMSPRMSDAQLQRMAERVLATVTPARSRALEAA
ncbi:MAG: DegT/DnrJ/EryC1/StrS family aminotransferase [Terricaulis sp.]